MIIGTSIAALEYIRKQWLNNRSGLPSGAKLADERLVYPGVGQLNSEQNPLANRTVFKMSLPKISYANADSKRQAAYDALLRLAPKGYGFTMTDVINRFGNEGYFPTEMLWSISNRLTVDSNKKLDYREPYTD